MKKFTLILALAAMLGTAAVSAQTPQPKELTVVFTVSPKMTCQNCENKIKTNMRFEKGVNDITTSVKDQTVTIKYNPKKTDTAKLTAAFKKIGYTATEKNTETKQ